MADNFKIITDSSCDLPESFINENDITVMNLSYTINNIEYNGDTVKYQQTKEFYDEVRAGAMPKTSQINPEKCECIFKAILNDGFDVLCISFSSALSGTCQTTKLVADRLKDEYPERKIFVIDSLCASLGQGLFIYYCINMKKEGKTITEIATWAEKNKLHVCHNFTVDDLNHLYRGGRVSKVSAVMGTLLGIKPVLHVDNEGKLVPLAKVRGRRQSLDALVDLMEKKIQNYDFDNKIFFISHGDSLEDAQYVQEQVTKRFKIKDCLISPVGPVIGTHSGPGTIALFFIGDER